MFIYVKNRFKGFSQKSFVFNEDGDKLFLIKGRLISPSNKTDICDMDGNKLFTVRNKIFPIFKNCVYIYDTSEKKKLFCKIKIKSGKYFKVVKCEHPITLNGNLEEGVAVSYDGEEVAYFEDYDIDEKTLITNSYELEIYDDIDCPALSVPLLSAMVVGMDELMLKLSKK